MRIVLLTAVAATLSACSGPAPGPSPSPDNPMGTPVDLNGLIGEWQDVQDSGRTVFTERWTRADDGTLSGFGFVLSGNDTVFIEHLGILRSDTATYYAATVNNQNSGAAVLFKLVHVTDSLVFENRAHDFPQRIVYVPVNGNWDVTVSGQQGGRTAEDRYHFTRRHQGPPAGTQ